LRSPTGYETQKNAVKHVRWISARTKAALAAKKASGVKLRNPRAPEAAVKAAERFAEQHPTNGLRNPSSPLMASARSITPSANQAKTKAATTF
jgi:hypothetical protein